MRIRAAARAGDPALSPRGAATAEAQKKTLVIALNQDPDILDPTIARTYVGRIVFAAMCEKLYEIDETLSIHPQLAAEMPRFTDGGKTVTIKLRSGVKFNDGTPDGRRRREVLARPAPRHEGEHAQERAITRHGGGGTRPR